MKLHYITSDALLDLDANFPTYKKHYMELDNGWFQDYFEKNGGLKESPFNFGEFTLDVTNDDGKFNYSDLKNINILYSALKDIPLSVAIDERFWTGLAHSDFWDYVVVRREAEIKSGKDQDIRNSFFFTRGVKRSAHIHCLSRLWWAGHLTYDKTRANPFELTELLCRGAFASTIMLLSSSNLTANKELILGILESIKKRSDEGEIIKRHHFVEATKYLNSMGSITILDTMKREKVTELIDKHFDNIFNDVETTLDYYLE